MAGEPIQHHLVDAAPITYVGAVASIVSMWGLHLADVVGVLSLFVAFGGLILQAYYIRAMVLALRKKPEP